MITNLRNFTNLNKITFLQTETPRRKMSLQCQWEVIVKTTEIHVMTVKGCEPRSKIAAFDMDGTIICTKSGRVFALNTDDWQLLYTPQVKQTLQRLYQDEGYKIVFITNQNGIASGKTKVPEFRRKVESVVETLGVPIQLFLFTAKYIITCS